MFDQSTYAKYMRSIQDTEYSVSINYYVNVITEVEYEVEEEGLNEEGKRIYEEEAGGFAVKCGDHYV